MQNSNIKEIFDIVNEKVDALKNEVVATDKSKVMYKPQSKL